jgi:ribosome maturation factor RimP
MPSHAPSSHSSQQRSAIDRAALLRVLEPVVLAHGAEVVDIEFRPERGGWVLRVFVEKAGASHQALSTRDAAVSLELCANVSRDLSPALDVVDLIPHAYQLEVSSPGVERPLRTERDFVRFAGLKARLKRRLEADGPAGDRVLVGLLGGVVDGRVRVVDGSRTHEIPLADVENARLVFEFGARGADAYASRSVDAKASRSHDGKASRMDDAKRSRSHDAKASRSDDAKASRSNEAGPSGPNEAGAADSRISQQRKH